ncbi:MAG: MBOAT family protein [Candidatus Doudnabacteria bacterium]|nr:MBOAT family protein [Candidatus Doudnabacteria bacterium]
MLFNSIEYFVFFPLAVFVYFVLVQRYRVLWLLLCSCYFYMVFRPVYVLILFFTIVVDYFAGLAIGGTENAKKRKMWLVVSLVANLGILVFFKYYNFFTSSINELFGFLHISSRGSLLDILLPVGLSFHTFQAMSYTIEVYRNNQKPEKNFLVYALYVMFFPQLVAGPIERPQNLLHQFYKKYEPDLERINSGMRLIVWGLFKKMVVADRLAPWVNTVYGNVRNYSGPEFVGATFLFAFQIYYDFSAYTDIARGSARVLGFELMKNFERPYAALSVRDFWRRWHISLSTWFKDYVYVPLGGNRVGVFRASLNLLFVFFLSGLWHGANWTYVIWGLLNGVYLVFGNLTRNIRSKWGEIFFGKREFFRSFFQWLTVFILINIAWVFFRVENLSDAGYIFSHLGSGWGSVGGAWILTNLNKLAFIGVGLAVVELVEWGNIKTKILERKVLIPALVLAVLFILFFGSFQNQQFIYFQF